VLEIQDPEIGPREWKKGKTGEISSTRILAPMREGMGELLTGFQGSLSPSGRRRQARWESEYKLNIRILEKSRKGSEPNFQLKTKGRRTKHVM